MATRSGGSRSGGTGSSKSGARRKGSAGASTRRASTSQDTDKSVEAFRDALERSVTLSRDRLQEVVDDAVKRGPTRLRVQRTAREFVAARACNGCVEIPVGSAAEAEDILLDLCFRPDESKLTPP